MHAESSFSGGRGISLEKDRRVSLPGLKEFSSAFMN